MGETQEGTDQWEKIKGIYPPGHSYEADQLYEQWDRLYGDGKNDFEVYVLTDVTRPVLLNFGPYIQFNHQPFYVGYGAIGHRHQESMKIGRNQDKYCHKTKRLNEIRARGEYPRTVIIGHFNTQKKAHLVERKLMNLICWSFLTNSKYHLCEIPLIASDCNVIYNRMAPVTHLKI